MEAPRQGNKLIRYAVLAVVIGLLVYNWYDRQKPLVREGVLEYRMITGAKDGQTQVILLETADRYFILDSAFREILLPEGEELVTRSDQLHLLEFYDGIEYRAGFSEGSGTVKAAYRATREVFNLLGFGETVKYEVDRKVPDGLKQLVD
ncbi:MAG: hypothetical protein R6V75_01555 [Bacteroidales bacterium]